MSVARDVQMGRYGMLRQSKLHGGILRQAISVLHRIIGVTWTRGHVREKITADEFAPFSDDALWQVLGNEAVDAMADVDRDAHPQPSEATRKSTGALVTHIRNVLSCATAVSPLWPKLPRDMERLSTGGCAMPKEVILVHDWGTLINGWHWCKACFGACRPANINKPRKCSGSPPFDGKLHPTHEVRWHAAGNASFAICLRCGAWAEKKALLLTKPCTNKVATHRKRNLKRLALGYHPDDRKDLRLD